MGTTQITPPTSPAAHDDGLADDRVVQGTSTASGISPRSPPDTETATARGWIGLGAVGLVAVLVFWWFDALPFQDLPAHAGLIAMRHRFASSPFEQKFYVLAPHVGPYSLFRFLGETFVRLSATPISAVRALATLPVIATPVALLYARRRLYGDRSPTYGFIGITLSFGIMTLLGFASYLLGMALMFVMITLWLELMDAVDGVAANTSSVAVCRRREIVVALAAPVMFVAHGHAFLLFLLTAFVSTLVVPETRWPRLLRLRAVVPALLLAAWVAWIEIAGGAPAGSVPRASSITPRFQGPVDKLGLLLSGTLMTRTGIDFVVGFVLLAFTVAASIVTVRSISRRLRRSTTGHERPSEVPSEIRHSQALYAAALAVTVIFLALPHAIGWFGFVDGRLVPVTLMLALLGIRRQALTRSMTRAMRIGAPILATTLVALAMVSSYRFQSEAAGYREVLDHVPAESRLLNLPLDPNSDTFTAHPFVHYDKLVLVERPIVVSDIWFHQGSALYPTPANPVLHLPKSYSESNLKTIDWPSYTLDDWDWVLIRTRPDAPAPFVPERLSLEAHRGGWWLFRRNGV